MIIENELNQNLLTALRGKGHMFVLFGILSKRYIFVSRFLVHPLTLL